MKQQTFQWTAIQPNKSLPKIRGQKNSGIKTYTFQSPTEYRRQDIIGKLKERKTGAILVRIHFLWQDNKTSLPLIQSTKSYIEYWEILDTLQR